MTDYTKIKNYLEWMEEAEDILQFAYGKLNNLTTEQFARGEDKEIRDMIADFLGIKE